MRLGITLVCDGERGMSGKSILRRNEREVEIPGMWERSCVALNSRKKKVEDLLKVFRWEDNKIYALYMNYFNF